MIDLLFHMERKRIGLHFVFWLLWIVSFTVLQSFGYNIDNYKAWLVYYLVTLPLFMTHTYVVAYWLLPEYFFKHRYLAFSCWIFVFLILTSVGELLISNELVWKLVNPENIQQGSYLNWKSILINGLGNEYIVIVFLSVKVIRFWNAKMSEKTDLQNRKISTEIELLQYQLYPRAVLNVIDRLEYLARIQSPQTSEMIIRLSNLMSNMTAIRKPVLILLKKEVEMIRNYIDIQQLSLPKAIDVNFHLIGELNSIQVPPFLFFQLVEEGFEVLDHISGKSDFTLQIKTGSKYLLFSMTIWNFDQFKHQFNPTVLENCHKYLNCFYHENHKVMSVFEINFVEITIEIYQ